MIGYRLKKVRKDKNLTLAEVANGIISSSYLSRIENGKEHVSEEILDLLSKRLGISLQELKGKGSGKRKEDILKSLKEIDHHLLRNKVEVVEYILDKLSLTQVDLLDHCVMVEYTLLRSALFLTKNQIREAEETVNNLSEECHIPLEYESRYYRICGTIEYKKGNLVKALEAYQTALNLSSTREMDDMLLTYNLGLTYFSLGYYTTATQYFDQAVSKFLQFGYLYNAIEAFIALGGNYYRLKDWKRSEEFTNKALQMTMDLQDSHLRVKCLHNLGITYYQLGDSDLAISYLLKAIRAKRTINQTKDLAQSLYSLAEIYLHKGDAGTCKDLLTEINELLLQEPDHFLRGRCDQLWGEYFHKVDDIENSIRHFEQSIRIFREGQQFLLAGDISYRLAEITDAKEHFKQSASFYRLWQSTKL